MQTNVKNYNGPILFIYPANFFYIALHYKLFIVA